MTVKLTLKTGTSLLVIGLLSRDQVETLATRALEEGLDSPRLRELAGGVKGSDELEDITSVLTDIGIVMPSPTDAARALAVSISGDILDGRIDAIMGAADLAKIARKLGPSFHEFDPFVYAWSEAESRPEQRDLFRKAVTEEASRWVYSGRGSV